MRCAQGELLGSPCVCRASSTISLNISSQTAGPIWTKLGRNVSWEVLLINCSQSLIPSKTLVAMVTKWNFLSNSFKIFPSGTTGLILKYFHRYVPRVTLLKNCSQIFDPSMNNSGLPCAREKSVKLNFFQGQGIVREFCEPSGKFENISKCQEIIWEF